MHVRWLLTSLCQSMFLSNGGPVHEILLICASGLGLYLAAKACDCECQIVFSIFKNKKETLPLLNMELVKMARK